MKYCLIGKKLSHSYSQVLHESYGLDYSLVELAPENLCDFVFNGGYDGFNVTIPYKKDIMRYLDGVSDLAERIGAVNTVVRRDGKLYGDNTDYQGFVDTLKFAGVEVKGKNVLLAGSGGASSMARVALSDMGAKSVTIVSRSGETNYSNCYELKDTQIVVNATPVGTFPEIAAAPLDIAKFKKLEFVFDLIYNPIKTALLEKADSLRIANSNGLMMLVVQALAARKIWTGEDYSFEDVKKLLSVLKSKTINIALVGMPSSGKSTIGKIVAKKLGKEFFDTDEEIFRKTGRTPEQIILSDGEKAFREIEQEVVLSVCKNRGAVIATGGGAVLKEINRKFLKATAFTVFIKRDPALLDDTSRPTLKSAGAKKLYEMRAPIYKAVSDFCVSNDASPERAAEEIIKAYENSGDQRS